MYCYFPEKRFGDDKVAWVTGILGKRGDLVMINDEYALLLGETIPLREIVTGHETATKSEKCYEAFLRPRTIDRILHMTQKRYSTYANTFSLRLGSDLQTILRHGKKKQSNIGREREVNMSEEGTISFVSAPKTTSQQIIIFPDMRTMHQVLPAKLFLQSGVARWHSGLTSRQQALIFWGCKRGAIHTLVSTHAGIFQDRSDVAYIYMIDAHKRWYKSQQDPRYRTPDVVDELQKDWSCVVYASGSRVS